MTSRAADPELWAEITGTGSAVVLLHSAVCDGRMWDPQWHHLQSDHAVVRLDLRGFGRTGHRPGPFRHAHDVISVMDRLRIASAVLVGSSLGGRVALETAVIAPDRVDGLFLAAPPLPDHDWSSIVREFGAAEGEALEAGDVDRAVELNVSLWLDGPIRDRANVDDATRALVADMQRTAFEHLLPHLDDDGEQPVDDLIARLSSIEAATSVVVGEHDVEDFHRIARTIVTAMPNAQMHVIVDSAHLPSLEAPDRFNRLLDEHLGIQVG